MKIVVFSPEHGNDREKSVKCDGYVTYFIINTSRTETEFWCYIERKAR
jgi:hypothetical protein